MVLSNHILTLNPDMPANPLVCQDFLFAEKGLIDCDLLLFVAKNLHHFAPDK